MTASDRFEPISTTPIPSEIEQARRILTAVLAAEPELVDALAISEALDRLLDVHPPYPPTDRQDPPTPPDVGIPTVITLLGEAVTSDTAIRDLYRYGETLVLLRDVLDGRATSAGMAS